MRKTRQVCQQATFSTNIQTVFFLLCLLQLQLELMMCNKCAHCTGVCLFLSDIFFICFFVVAFISQSCELAIRFCRVLLFLLFFSCSLTDELIYQPLDVPDPINLQYLFNLNKSHTVLHLYTHTIPYNAIHLFTTINISN